MSQNIKAGIVFPSGKVKTDIFENGLSLLKDFSDIEIFKTNFDYGYFAGTDIERTTTVLRALRSDSDILISARGGFGSIKMDLKAIQAELKKYPKPICGFSDITVLLELWWKTDVRSFHSPVITQLPILEDNSLNYFMKFLSNGTLPQITVKPVLNSINNSDQVKIKAGNLTVFGSISGTFLSPVFKNHYVLLEDINEPDYKIDRILSQLFLGTDLSQSLGIILGQFSECSSNIEDIVVDAVKKYAPSIFIGSGANIGHSTTNQIVEYGGNYTLRNIGSDIYFTHSGE
ncbi:MAG: LD-carboxypeptidase [Deltaproteobacteria bacterium]|nr:LD-carboxypeptidase [Deltaproteobacteria bacterium]